MIDSCSPRMPIPMHVEMTITHNTAVCNIAQSAIDGSLLNDSKQPYFVINAMCVPFSANFPIEVNMRGGLPRHTICILY